MKQSSIKQLNNNNKIMGNVNIVKRSSSSSKKDDDDNNNNNNKYLPIENLKNINLTLQDTYAKQIKKNYIDRFESQLLKLNRSINMDENQKENKVRFVFLSDTHGYHRHIKPIPKGDVLLHTGDICANYNIKDDVLGQFQDFLNWLEELHTNFSHMVFIAGNHDTFLDYKYSKSNKMLKSRYEKAKQMLLQKQKKIPNLIYLENNSCVVKGNIKIFGTPISQCRAELYNKCYLSSAFETKKTKREVIYKSIPDENEVCILMTHGPPKCDLCPNWGDDILTNALLQRKYPIQFHCFGHDHKGIGISQGIHTTVCGKGGEVIDTIKLPETVFINGALQNMLRDLGNGFVWTFDCEIKKKLEIEKEYDHMLKRE